jgi:hypothetical protein
MPRVLHVIKRDHADLALAVITSQAAAGDQVGVALLGATPEPALPAGVIVHRVPDDISYERLLELIFEADSVVTW